MNNISIIAAIGKNNELGKNGKLIWHLKEDMKYFKENTIGKPIVMGINTFNSLPKLLENRKHIVLTHQNIEIPNVKIYHSKEELLSYLKYLRQEIMVIGGASIYRQFIDIADKLLLTEIDEVDKEADAYFPRFNKDNYNKEIIKNVKESNINYKFVRYLRKK